MSLPIQHIVLWWLKDSSTDAQRTELIEAARALAGIPGVTRVSAGLRHAVTWLGPEDTFDVGLVVSFASADAMETYGPHPLHTKCVEIAGGIMDRFMAFYIEGQDAGEV